MIPYAQRPRRMGGVLGANNPNNPNNAIPGMKPPQPAPPQATGGNMAPVTMPQIKPMTPSTGGNMTPNTAVQTKPLQVTGGNAQASTTMANPAATNTQAQTLAQNFGTGMQQFQPFADAAYDDATRRLDPQFAQADASFRQQMVNQGLAQGTEAYDKAFANFSRDKNDAYSSARNQSLAQALAAQGQAFGQDFGQQRADMSDLMGLLGYGNNVTMGNNQTLNSDQQRAMALFGFIPGMSSQPLDVMGSANMYNQQNMFNQQQQQNRNNSYWQAAGQLGSAFLGGWGGGG